MPARPASNMTAAQFLRALARLGWTPYSAAEPLGISLRQSHRYASGETAIPETVAILLRLLLERAR